MEGIYLKIYLKTIILITMSSEKLFVNPIQEYQCLHTEMFNCVALKLLTWENNLTTFRNSIKEIREFDAFT